METTKTQGHKIEAQDSDEWGTVIRCECQEVIAEATEELALAKFERHVEATK